MMILVVDDNEQNCYQLQVLLGSRQHQVVTAVNGAEALTKARQDPPDLIVSDILMPVMDGFALCREWKQDERLRSIPFIFYTATYTDERDRDFALGLGAERFLIKPAEPETFLREIGEVIQQVQRPSGTPPPRIPVEAEQQEEAGYLKQYNEVLVRKLEAKMQQLEQTNRELMRDIAERRLVEESLRRASEIINSSPAVAFIWENVEGWPVRYVSENVEQMFGFTAEDFVSGTVSYAQVVHPDDQARVAREVVSSGADLTTHTVAHTPYRIVTKRGDVKWVEDLTTILRKEDGLVDAYRGIVQDITERKRAEATHEKLQAQFTQAQKMESVGRLAGGVAHDFNNLLMGVMNYVELCRDAIEPDDPIREWLDEIMADSQRSANLTRQLLAFARKQTIAPKVLDLNDTVTSMLKLLRRLIGEDIDLAWLPGAGLGTVEMDPSQIDQILANLTVNARDAIGGVGKLSIETKNATFDADYCAIHAEAVPGAYVMLAVSDTGCGMDAETREHIFEPFFTTKGVGEGTGLGLATVYGIVKQNNGFINVYSEPGEGTTFKIYLPWFEGETSEASETGAASPRPGGNETILLVEDEKSIRVTAALFLEASGYTVLVAEDPEQALRLTAEHSGRIHLLVSDVVMPGLSGRDLAKQLTTDRPEMKRLFMSGYTANVIAHRGILDEGVEFLGKPFSRDELARKVREVLDA